MFHRFVALLCLALLSLAVVGCDSATEEKQPSDGGAHAGHGPIESFADAVAELKEMHASITKTFAEGGDPHEALHPLSKVLVQFDDLIGAEESFDDEQKAAAKDAVESLIDGYSTIDEAIHHGQQPDFDSVKESLDSAVATLAGMVPGA